MNSCHVGIRPLSVRLAVAAILGTSVHAGIALAAESETEGLDEVTVTGTRIQQRGDYVSPTPMATFGAADLEKLGIVNVSDAITQIPQNVSQFTPANTGGSAFFVGSTLANLRGLNPFFGTRTLTLVDSRRFIPTTQGDSVDLNFIPSNMISRMEVVTGGASAAYGSGAISGVVNVMLDKELTGIKVDLDYGVTGEGDGDNWHAGIAGGFDFAGDRGHIIIGGEYQNNEVIQSCADARTWCGAGRGWFDNNTGFAFAAGLPFVPKVAGQPHYVVTQGLTNNQTSRSGVIFQSNVGGAFGQGGFFGPPGAPIAPATNQTWQFNAAGTDIVPFTVGQEGWRSIGGLVVGGDGDRAYTNLTLYPDVERITAMTHVDFDLTENLGTYAELSYGQVKAQNAQWETGQNSTGNCIKSDNAYLGTLSTNARNALAAASGNSPFGAANEFCVAFAPGTWSTVVQKNWQGQNSQVVFTDTEVIRGVVGLNGNFAETWRWDAYYQYGKTTRDQIGDQYRTNQRYTMAVDAVLDTRPGSATLGQPVCRVTNTGILPPGVDPSLAQGCVPLNTFGNAASPAALAYAFGDLTEHDDIRQDVIAVSANGQLWEGWGAGALNAAAGVEYRKESLENNAGPLPFAIRTDFPLQYGDSFAGDTEVTEGFVELEMGILKDLPLVQQLTLNGAYRFAHYTTTGGAGTIGGTNTQDIPTWKLAAIWDTTDWLRIRGSHSSDIRAAGFRELFYSQSIPEGGFFGTVNNPFQNPPVNNGTDNSVLILSGNPAIEPEEATTTTIGFILSPGGWGDGLRFSADYYDIELDGGMALGNAQQNVNDCAAGDQEACDLYVVFGTPLPGNTPRSNITSTRAIYINQQSYSTKGIDFSLDYALPINRLVSDGTGTLSFRLTASHTIETIIPSGNDVAGQTGVDQGFLSDFAASPDWSGNLTVSYSTGRFTGTIQARYISDAILDMQNPKTDPTQEGYDPTLTYSITDNTIPSYFNFNLSASYDFQMFNAERTEAFVTINNLLNKDPLFAGSGFQGTGGTNAVFYDALGRNYRLGVRMKF